MSPRTFDPGLPSWMREDELAGLMNRTVSFTRIQDEEHTVRYRSHFTVSIEELVRLGHLNEDDIGDASYVEDAAAEWGDNQDMDVTDHTHQNDGDVIDHWTEDMIISPQREEVN